MFLISGSISSAVRLWKLDNEWQQKKQTGKIFSKEMTAEEKMIQQYKEDAAKMRENSRLAEISSRIKSGGQLTYDELQYLMRKNPGLYKQYQEIQMEKQAYEEELKNCKTKDEADKLRMNKMNAFVSELKKIVNNPAIPQSEKKAFAEKIIARTAYINKVHNEFIETGKYAALPENDKDERERGDSMKTPCEAEDANGITQEKYDGEALLPGEYEAVFAENSLLSKPYELK